MPGEIYRITSLWITSHSGNILLARRSHLKQSDPGKWAEAVTGTVEEGETYESNIVKEIKEELGLTFAASDLKKGPKVFYGIELQALAQWYILEIDESTVLSPDPEEVAEIRWFTPSELKEYYFKHQEEFVGSFLEDGKRFGIL